MRNITQRPFICSLFLASDHFGYVIHKFIKAHGTQVTLVPGPYRDGTLLDFLVPYYKHKGYFLHLGFPYLVSHLFIPQVGFNPEPLFKQLIAYLGCIIVMLVGYW